MNDLSSYTRISEAAITAEDLVVVFASLEGDIVDQHFGASQGFYAYLVNAESAVLIAQKAFGYEKRDGNEDKLKPKLEWLVGADLVYCGSIGGSATRQLLSLGITPFQVKEASSVEELIKSIQTQLKGEQEFWLKNILNKKRQHLTGGVSSFTDGEWEEY